MKCWIILNIVFFSKREEWIPNHISANFFVLYWKLHFLAMHGLGQHLFDDARFEEI